MSHAYLLFALMALAAVASPGPGVFMTLDNALGAGWRAAMQGVAGLVLGSAVLIGLGCGGLGLVLRASPAWLAALQYGGAAYLLFLALRAWRSVPTVLAAPGPSLRASGGRLLRGLLLQLSNPKALLFFLAALPPLVQARSADSGVATWLLAASIYGAVLCAVHGLYAGAATRGAAWLRQPRFAVGLRRFSALVFAGFALALLAWRP